MPGPPPATGDANGSAAVFVFSAVLLFVMAGALLLEAAAPGEAMGAGEDFLNGFHDFVAGEAEGAGVGLILAISFFLARFSLAMLGEAAGDDMAVAPGEAAASVLAFREECFFGLGEGEGDEVATLCANELAAPKATRVRTRVTPSILFMGRRLTTGCRS